MGLGAFTYLKEGYWLSLGVCIKFNPNGSVVRLKANLVVIGYAQTYGVDHSDTFSPIAKLTSIRLFISLAASYDWDLHQLDIMNVFLH